MRLRSPGRQATVLVRIHSPACEGCRAFLTAVAGAEGDLGSWDGRVLVVVPGSLHDAASLRAGLALPFAVLADDGGNAPLAGGAGVIIADRFDQIFHLEEAGDTHRFSPPRELEEWLKFIATQCPE